MAQADDRKLETVNRGIATRRDFFARALAATSGVAALSGILETMAPEAAAQAPCPPEGGAELKAVGAIRSQNKKLLAVMRIKNQKRKVGTGMPMLRYFEGYNASTGQQQWPPAGNTAPVPGPTLEAWVGDTVQISFFNQVNTGDFLGSLDHGEEGRDNGCDQSNHLNKQQIVDIKNWYPADDKYPNCLHGSSTANIHFHGTHTTPDTTGDNVLLQIRPLSQMTAADEKKIQAQFKKIFDAYDAGVRAKTWTELKSDWTTDQETALKHYDDTAPYTGPNAKPNGHGLPPDLRLWPQDAQANLYHLWPQWYVGSFPYSFTLPEFPGGNPEYPADPSHDHGSDARLRMGQSPGTHWYHAHKHGSTAINSFNGLAGAFIIRGKGYDGALDAWFQKSSRRKATEKLMIVQQISGIPNLLSSAGGPPPIYVNGQSNKSTIVTMQPGEVQLWRIVNATAGGGGAVTLNFTPVAGAPAIQYKQIAQDGVQFAWENYANPQNGKLPIIMSPGNRVDLLVQAPVPATTGCYTWQFGDAPFGRGPLLTLVVQQPQTPVNLGMTFPQTKGDFPPLPEFLHDIDAATIHLRREVTYGWKGPTAGNGPDSPAGPKPGRDFDTGAAPHYTIDGRQFEDQRISQSMLLDTAEEWTIYNSTVGIAHPFHIHINPFQIIEVFDPAKMREPLRLSEPFVWWDTFGIPPGSSTYPDGTPRTDRTGKQIFVPGYFKMRSRFVDFTGTFVNHCHILAHEDRGMMQLVQVVPNRTTLKHH